MARFRPSEHRPATRKKIALKSWLGIPAGALVLVIVAYHLWPTVSGKPSRVNRQHFAGIPARYSSLTLRPASAGEGPAFTRTAVEADLDQLKWIIEHEYSYRDLKGVNYRACLDAIRSGLGDGITRGDLAYQLAKVLALFGDGHSKVASKSLSIENLCSGFLPFLISESEGRLVAYTEDRAGFVDAAHPFVTKLDGVPVQKWIDAASQWVAAGSQRFVRLHSIRHLRDIALLRQELGLAAGESVRIELESADHGIRKLIELPLAKSKPNYGFWPAAGAPPRKLQEVQVATRRLDDNIGYIRIPIMLESPAFLASLVAAMHDCRKTAGLILDIRGNGGGSRATLRTLFPFFVADDQSPQVVNVAACRLGSKDRRADFQERYLYPVDSKRWSDAERQVIREFAETFRPEWPLPEGMFSGWHYFLIGPDRHAGSYHYGKPVVILQDSANFSAADIFLGAFKGRKNVTLMGLPSGGGSGCRIEHRLENTRIAVYLSSMVSYRPDGQLYDGKGINPDIPIGPQPGFFVGKEDSVLDRAVQLLKEKGQVQSENR